MIRTIFTAMVFFAAAAFPQSLTLISPNGGETFTSGQPVLIQWTSENIINNDVFVQIDYSVKNGMIWRSIGPHTWATAGSQIWTPMVKKRVDKAVLRISADTTSLSPRDSSDSSFTILPMPGDAYEPNDDFSSAYSISTGDSAVKNAFVFGVDSLEPDSAFFDVDYYKISLEAGKLLTISLFPWNTDRFGADQRLAFALFDSSKSLLYSGDNKVYNVTRTGTYYIEIRNIYYVSYEPPCRYGLSIQQSDYNGLIAIISPKGGETFNPEDSVSVQWQADSAFSFFGEVSIEYSIDSGKSWRDASNLSSSFTSYSWRVPHLKHRTDRSLIRAIPNTITNAIGVSSGTFTILASPNDAYEPNDDFASAKAVEFGDTVVKNAIVMKGFVGSDSSAVDTSLTDNDFFKLNLTAGKVVTISNVCDHRWDDPEVLIRLYDASKNEIDVGSTSFSCYIPQTGVYYCEVSSIYEYDCWNKYCLSIHQADGAITLISPNGGESFTAGQKATVTWTADSSLGGVELSYSRNNGTSWEYLGYSSSFSDQSYFWEVPALRARTDQALVKVAAIHIANPPSDVSNGTFTIQAAPKDDPYEPNNDLSSAYPIAVGDSVVKNASICWYADIPDDSSGIDFYKVNLLAGSLVWIRSWASEGKSVSCELLDASQHFIPDIEDFGYYDNIIQSGVYYLRIKAYEMGDWAQYGLSIRSMKTLISQHTMLDSTAMQYDSSSDAYRVQFAADTTKLAIDLKLNHKCKGSITTLALAPNDCAPLPDEKAKVRAIAIIPRLDYLLVKAVEIAIPYTLSDLNGYPEKALAAACEDWKSGIWDSVPSSIDTVKHQIIVHTTDLTYVNLFQVYVKSNTGIGPISATIPPVFGIRANFLSQKQSIVVHFTLLKAANANLRLYDVQGKCVRKGVCMAGAGSSTLLWNLGGLSNGKYFLTMKVGNYYTKESILIMK